jgi:DNA (cytosine-5)-methyltransferase 1
MVIEWAVLDAQHFGVPQRRRRVFVIAVFDPAIAQRCPDPLLPVRESVRGDTAKGKPKGQAASSEVANCLRVGSGVGERGDGTDNLITGFGSASFGGWTETDTAITLSARDHKSSNTIAVETVGALCARDHKGVGSQYVDEGKVIVEPFVKSRRAQTSDDDETWVQGEVNPTLNSFDVGETRSTTAIVEPTLSFDTQFGSNANVTENVAPTVKATQQAPSIQHNSTVRRLTPLECERLMGWPDNWTDGQADSHRYKQCGNGVASPVAQWIAQHLLNL